MPLLFHGEVDRTTPEFIASERDEEDQRRRLFLIVFHVSMF